MVASQNSWPASPDPAVIGIVPVTVAGVPIGDGLAGGRSLYYLTYVAEQFHRRVEPLVPGTCWGYKYRPIIGATELSNHASGTALDLNADQHPLGAVGTFTDAQVAEIRAIVAELGGVVRWGGEWSRVDSMHFEIALTPEEMPMLGLDYSAGRPRGSEVKRLGYGFVIRYCGRPGGTKNATQAEVADMLANGVAVALVFETTAARAGEGFNAGVADAQAAVAHQAQLGIPASRPIYYAVDYDADPVAVEPYFRGLNSVAGPDSAYGSFRVVQRLRTDGLTVDSWQTVAWSHGQVDGGRDVFQRLGTVYVDGIACDVNEAFTTDFGQYPAGGTVTTPWTDSFTAKTAEGDKPSTYGNAVASLYGLMFFGGGGFVAVAPTVRKIYDAVSKGVELDPEKTAGLVASAVGAAAKNALAEYYAANPPPAPSIDYAALAKAVNDDAARRLAE